MYRPAGIRRFVQGGRSAPSPRPASSPTSGRSSSLGSPRSAFRLFLLRFRGFRRARAGRFVAFLGEGELSDSPAEPYRYRIVVQGREGDRNIVWYYYLIASPEGDQLLATFTLNADDMKRFGNQDLELTGSIEWRGAGSGAE